jgi:hypothetical protein
MSVDASDSGAFSFGVKELAHAENRDSAARNASLNPTPPQAPESAVGGFDPYNSTGGFDRTNAWKRIRKR